MQSVTTADIWVISRATKMSNRIFFMGELSLDITVGADGKAACGMSDMLVNTALLTAPCADVAYIGEASADLTGNLIVSALTAGGIDIAAVDRITEGQSPVTLRTPDHKEDPVIYSAAPAEGFNPVWPRINPGDLLVWGSYFSLDKRVHPMLLEILRYARARKATLLYVPYFSHGQVARVTRVMPEIFDNLELADAVFATTDIMTALFDNADMDAVYCNNLNFYTSLFYAATPSAGEIVCYRGGTREVMTASCRTADMLAGVVAGMFNSNHDGIR